jgi:hypothetical protein
MTNNNDLLNQMAIGLIETWPDDSPEDIAGTMQTILEKNGVNISPEEIKAAVSQAFKSREDFSFNNRERMHL